MLPIRSIGMSREKSDGDILKFFHLEIEVGGLTSMRLCGIYVSTRTGSKGLFEALLDGCKNGF